MFGYINANSKELTDQERELYQSYYCGLCRRLKNQSGSKGQMLLNYDMTFLIILLSGLYEPEESTEQFTCSLHPLQKKISRVNEFTDYAARMNVLLSYQNFQDDWQDNRSLVKKSMAHLFRKDYMEIRRHYPRQAEALERYMSRLTVAESGNEKNLDVVAGLTGEMLGEMFAVKTDEWTEELKGFGFYMGKFIYLMDAFEDVEDDQKKGLYNPFLDQVKDMDSQEFNTYVRLILTSMMAECAKSFERLPVLKNAGILRNILYSGVWTRFDLCQAKRNQKNKKQEEQKK